MTKNEKLGEKIKKIVELLVESLERAGIKYFQSNPTAEFAHRGENIMVSLIDENNSDVKYKMNQNLHVGKKYFFINRNTLLNPNYDILYIVHPLLKKIDEELKEESSFKTNLERVSALIKTKHYSVALVFIVSALESIFSDIFYRYNYLWFLVEIIKSQNYDDDDLIIQYGSRLNEHDKEYPIFLEKEIDGEKWVLTSKYLPLINKWLNLKVWECILTLVRNLGHTKIISLNYKEINYRKSVDLKY
ncbi:hypothetical protein LCGC14_1419410 [marine sediment metagenome]|uniref:Uncharacterized protein n=1 Tax=marine sediment metagenome TaxID=412755 RepID=A0A0F9MTI6_9ZZZZ